MKYKDLHTYAWLEGLYERWTLGDGFGRSHETDHDWNEAYDSGANMADRLRKAQTVLMWYWRYIIKPIGMGIFLLGMFGLVAFMAGVIIHYTPGEVLAAVAFIAVAWIAGRVWQESNDGTL
jgi:hypothetical protein